MARTGRRAGDAGTREAIISAARGEFAHSGYNAATIRAIARRAGVDPALVYHYFGDKPALFVATAALPKDPRDIRNATQATHQPGSPGVRLVANFLAQWEADPAHQGRPFVVLAQAVSSSPDVARSLREFLSERIWAGREDTGADAQWRFNAISSQLVGLAWSRYIVQLEPLASASRSEVAARFGPAIEALMTGGPAE